MSNNLIAITPSAYDYPLLIKHLLHAPLSRSPGQVIVYREHRHTYRQFRDRVTIPRQSRGLSGCEPLKAALGALTRPRLVAT